MFFNPEIKIFENIIIIRKEMNKKSYWIRQIGLKHPKICTLHN